MHAVRMQAERGKIAIKTKNGARLSGEPAGFWEKVRTAAERPLVGIYFGAAGTIMSSVIVPLVRDPRPALALAWICAALMVWEISRVLSNSLLAKSVSTVIGSLVFAGFYVWLYFFLAPHYVERPTYGPVPATYCYDESNPSGELQDRFKKFKRDVDTSDEKVEGCTLVINSASILIFEHATFIWMFAPKKGSYILYSTGEARFIPESSYCEDEWCREDTKEALARFEKILGRKPPNLHTPYGQSAVYFDENHEESKKIGWLKWLCEIDENSLLYQKLSNGFAVGIYPTTRLAGADYQGEVIFVNEIDAKWSSVGEMGARVPSCR